MGQQLGRTPDILQRIRLIGKAPQDHLIASLEEVPWRNRISRRGANGRLRILMVIAVPPEMTGSGMVVKNLTREIITAGDDISLLVADYKPFKGTIWELPNSKVDTVVFCDTGAASPQKAFDVHFPIPTFSAGMPFPYIRYINMTRSQLTEFLEVFYGYLERAIHRVQPDIIHTHHLFLLNPLVQLIAPWIPLVSQVHGTELKMLQEDGRLLPFVAPAARLVDKVLSISNAVTKDVIQLYGVVRNKIVLVGNGVDKTCFHSKELTRQSVLSQFGLSRHTTRIVLFVGKFSKWKGIQYLIGSAAIYTHQGNAEPVTTLIVGGGSPQLRQNYLDQIQAHGLEEWVKVIDLGGSHQETVSLLMNIADVFVLPSVSEPLGMVLLEAMACGVRVVAANRGGPTEIISNELQQLHLACLVDPIKITKSGEVIGADIFAYEMRLANAINRILSIKKITKWEQNLLVKAVPTWERVYMRIRSVYKQVIAERAWH